MSTAALEAMPLAATSSGAADDVPVAARSARFHIPSLDGFRAIAVIMVFLSHAGYRFIPAGFGVTVFFFLSGYLITTLLRYEYEKNGRINLGKFYLRRVLRIWPPMYIALALAVILCWLGYLGRSKVYPTPLAFQAAHLTNVYQLWGASWFGRGDPILLGTTVLWSLAVEEHFYLVFPVLLIFLLGRTTRLGTVRVLLGICLAVLAWRCFLVLRRGAPEIRIQNGTDTRFDSILFGCILGLWNNPYLDPIVFRRRWQQVALLALSALLLCLTSVFRSERFPVTLTFRYTVQGLAMFPVFYFAVVNSRWPIWSWLSWAPIRAVGLMSYTIYLVHLTILDGIWGGRIALYGGGMTKAVNTLAGAAITIAFAAASYYVVERPCASLRKKLHAR